MTTAKAATPANEQRAIAIAKEAMEHARTATHEKWVYQFGDEVGYSDAYQFRPYVRTVTLWFDKSHELVAAIAEGFAATIFTSANDLSLARFYKGDDVWVMLWNGRDRAVINKLLRTSKLHYRLTYTFANDGNVKHVTKGQA